MPTYNLADLQNRDNWLDDRERRIRFFGWTDEQVARLYVAAAREMDERGVALQLSLLD